MRIYGGIPVGGNLLAAAGNSDLLASTSPSFPVPQVPGQQPRRPYLPGEVPNEIDAVFGTKGPIPIRPEQTPMLPQAYGFGGGMYQGSTPMGNAGAMAQNDLSPPNIHYPYTPLPTSGWHPGLLPAGSTFRPSPVNQPSTPTINPNWQAAGFQAKFLS